MHKYLKKLVDERNSLTALMSSVTDKAVAEDRELTDAESERVRGWQERAAEIDRQAAEQNEMLESTRAWARLQDKLTTDPDPDAAPSAGRRGATGAVATRAGGWGEAFVNSDKFRSYAGYGSCPPVEVGEVFETRAPIDTTFLDQPPHQFVPTQWVMTTPLLDAITHERVSTGTVEWLRWPGAYPEAQVVAEGALKPEATVTPTTETASLNTIAHWKGITRQALEDFNRIQSIIENFLRGGILRKLEADTATALTSNTDIEDVDADDLLSGIRIALGNVQSAGYATANAVLLNPADWADLDISVMGVTVNGPVGTNQFWGLRPIAAAAVPAGTAYVGDFKTGITMFERNTASVYMTDSHADNFIRNVLVILAETRALSVVTEPAALQKVTVTAAPPV